MKIPFKQLAKKHTSDITAFVLKMISHQGKINPQYIYKVMKQGERIDLKHPETIEGEYINGGIRIPGEITNSFCTLYEVGYFVNALFLDSVVSSLPFEKYKTVQDKSSLPQIVKKDILSLSDDEIEKSFHSPKIPIISWLTDDVETYRFRKEMLWGVKKRVSRKIIGEIKKEDLGQESSKEFYNVLWIDKDKEITDTAIKYAQNMCEGKMIQYYLALEEFFGLVGIDLSKIPFYFFCSPYHELLDLGPEHPFLEFLIEIHNQKLLKIFSKITHQQYPIFIKIPCPKCGESSKKILQGRLKGEKDKRTVRLICAKGIKSFKNEHGLNTLEKRGCGYTWEYRIPDTPKELYNFLKEKGFSLHVTLANLLQVFKNTAISPIAHVICDLNIYYDKNKKIKIFSPYPGGYGSSAELFTSIMGIQLAFLRGLLAPNFISKAKKEDMIVNSPFMIVAHQSPSKLYDSSDIYKDILRDYKIETGPQDSGIWKVLDNGMTPEEVIIRSIDPTYYPAEKMFKDIRGIDINAL